MHHPGKSRLGRQRRSIRFLASPRGARLRFGFGLGGAIALGGALLPSCGDPGDEFRFSEAPAAAGSPDGAQWVGAAGQAGDGSEVRKPREIGAEGGSGDRGSPSDPDDGEGGAPSSGQGGSASSPGSGSGRGGSAAPGDPVPASGGTSPASGGVPSAQGGSASPQGGSPAQGGAPASGGAVHEGGAPGVGGAGGAAETGGASEGGTSPTGGSAATGGASAQGGSGGTLDNGGVAGGSGASGGSGPAAPPAVFFSEYVEGSGKHKAFEIVALAPRALDGCAVRVYANGSMSASRVVMLAGTASLEAPFVVCTPELAAVVPGACDQEESLPFNGNDAIVLSCADTVLDVLGRVGEDPGEAWGSESLSTLDMTLRRSCDVLEGDAEASDAFDPSLQWQAAPLDSFEDLNRHCAPVSP